MSNGLGHPPQGAVHRRSLNSSFRRATLAATLLAAAAALCCLPSARAGNSSVPDAASQHRAFELNSRGIEIAQEGDFEAGIQLVLVSTPLHPQYVGRLPTQLVTKFQEVWTELTLLPRVVGLDYSTMPLEAREYLDFDHANQLGAARISAAIRNFLESGVIPRDN